MSRSASKVEKYPSGDPNGGTSKSSCDGEVIDGTLISRSSTSSPPLTGTETLKLVETKETSTTSETVQSAIVNPTDGKITSKYKSKEEKKKARLARRKANRAKYCSKRGKTRKPPNEDVSKENCSSENQVQTLNEATKDQPPKKLTKDTAADEHRRSINKCRHLAVAVRREDKAPVDQKLAKLIRKKLTDLIGEEVESISNADSSATVIKFKKSGLVSSGYFLVTPATVETRDWLLSRDFGLLDGTRVVAKKLERKKVKTRSGDEKRRAAIPVGIK